MAELMGAPHRGRTINEYVRVLLKRRWAALAVFICLVGIAALYSFTATPIYKATVQILIERQTPRVLEQAGAPAPYDPSSEEFYQTQYKLLESRALIKKVVDKLQLKEHRYYSVIFKGLPSTGEEAAKQQAEESLMASFARNTEVRPIRQSSLVDVSFSHPDPKFTAQVANALARCYIEQSLELRFAASQETAGWLEQKLVDARKKLEDSEAKLNQYKREFGIVALDDKESITAQKLEQLNKELVTAQTRRMEAESRYKEVKQNKPIPQVLNNPLIQSLKTQEAKVIAEQSELGKKYGPMHPRMIQLNHELSATRAKIQAEKVQVEKSIENE
jgi:succinoglycan biosynthesis transport protein ExoP